MVRPYRYRPRLAARLARRLLAVGFPNFVITAAVFTPNLIMPIIAAEILSAHAAAYWYVAWMMAAAAYTIPTSFGVNLFAEVKATPERSTPETFGPV